MKIRTLSWILIGGVVLIVTFYAGTLIYLTWPIKSLSVSSSGVFGDSFGLLTSLFSGLAFAGLIITIAMQREELTLQREELTLTRKELSSQNQEMQSQNETLKVQRFENTFFKMLEVLEACRNDISHQPSQGLPSQGRDAVKRLYDSFTGIFLTDQRSVGIMQEKVFKEECKTQEGLNKRYIKFYEKYGDELGQYYRTLYNILKLVDQSDFITEKSVYTNLVRAQLSRYELSLLFYNSLSDLGREKMAPLIIKYKILKHLEGSTIPAENQDILKNFNA
ncbi:hypothetical protein D3C78_691520 [compost metagenome]